MKSSNLKQLMTERQVLINTDNSQDKNLAVIKKD